MIAEWNWAQKQAQNALAPVVLQEPEPRDHTCYLEFMEGEDDSKEEEVEIEDNIMDRLLVHLREPNCSNNDHPDSPRDEKSRWNHL